MKILVSSAIAFLAAAVVWSSSAVAQPAGPPASQPPPPPGSYTPPVETAFSGHRGIMVGFSLGFGSQIPDCDSCESESGMAFDFSIGGFVSPKLAIMYDVSAVTSFHSDFGFDYQVTTAVNAVAAQYWVGPQIWLKGGLGIARAFFTGDLEDAESENGTAVTVAGGYEVMQSGNFAMDVQLRLGMLVFDEVNITNAALMLGFNWY